MKVYFERRVLSAFIITITILIGLGVYSYRNNVKLVAYTEEVSHTNQVLYNIEQVLSSVVDLETGLRGYLVTNDALFLEPYHQAIVKTQNGIEKVRKLTQDNPRQITRIERITTLMDRQFDFSHRLIEARKGGFDEARKLMSTLEGKGITDELRVIIEQMRKEELTLRDMRSKQRDDGWLTFTTALVTLITITALITITLFLMLNRYLRKRMESEEKLKESSELIYDLYNNAPVGYVSLNKHGVVEDANATLLQWIGIKKDQIIGKTFKTFLAPEDAPTFQKDFERFSEVGSVDHLEYHLLNEQGERIPVMYNASALVDGDGNFKMSRSALSNISDRKNAELRTQQLNKELEAFTYSVSHDLRAPLRSINGYAKILEEDYGKVMDAEGNRLIQIIIRNARNMGKLIDDLLDFSRVGRKEFVKSTVNMQQVVQAVLSELPSHSAAIRIGELLSAPGDMNMIKQVWINLIGNAVKYSSRTSQPIVTVESFQRNQEIVYCVQDNGVGFDMQYVHKLFGVFQRLHKSTDFEGTGVGLALVQRIVNRHGGKVWAEGSPNEGAMFYFSLPTSLS
jgi:PAS domain S-box-containing protein